MTRVVCSVFHTLGHAQTFVYTRTLGHHDQICLSQGVGEKVIINDQM